MGVLRGFVLLVLFITMIPISLADITINEIMSRPISDESLNEWIELYNSGSSIDIAGWKIGDNNDNDTLEGGKYGKAGTMIPANSYALITDDNTRVYDNFNTSSSAIRIYVDDASIGNGLSNSGETLYLYDNNGNIIQQLTFSETSAGNSWANINGNLQESSATPGYSNTGQSSQNISVQTCDWKITILLNKTVFLSEEFTWRIKAEKLIGDSTQLSSKVTIEDSDGITNDYLPWTAEDSTSQKTSSTYTPNLKPGAYIIKANLSTACQDTDTSNNKEALIFTIKEATSKASDSYIAIEKVPEKEYTFGDIVMPKVNIYRGDTQKYAVKAYIEKDRIVSEETTIHIDNKYENLSVSIPIKLKENCDNKFSAGAYNLKIEGLEKSAVTQINIKEQDCKISVKQNKFYQVILDIPSKLNLGEDIVFYGDLFNDGESPVNFSVWSYLQKGTRLYGDKKENLNIVEVPAKKSVELKLRNKAPESEGEYKLKVTIFDSKEERVITKNLTIKNEQIKELKDSSISKDIEISNKEENIDVQQGISNKITGQVVRQEVNKEIKAEIKEYSVSNKYKDWTLYGLIVVLASLCTYLLFRPKIPSTIHENSNEDNNNKEK